MTTSIVESDDPSRQLYASLQASVTDALSTKRPLLTHLNADTTWLLSLPYPINSENPHGRAYFHILLDPWLRGGQSDVARFFSQQWHKQASAVQTIAEVEDVIRGIEDAAKGTLHDEQDIAATGEGSWIDVVAVSHEFTDHMHKETLLEIPSTVPVLATVKAAAAIRSWRHFSNVEEIPRFSGDWTERSISLVPSWLSISRVAYPGVDLLYYHSAVMVTFSLQSEEIAEAVIYTPHGITPRDIEPLATANPKIKTLALLHGLQDITLTAKAQLNLGAYNGLKIQRALNAKYWVATHDEIKTGGGLVSWFLNRKIITLREALEKEGEDHNDKAALDALAEVTFVDIGNGESLILE